MSEIYGKKLVCDLCNNSVFLEQKNADKMAPIYRSSPAGWSSAHLDPFSGGVSTLCPKCTVSLKRVMDQFISVTTIKQDKYDG